MQISLQVRVGSYIHISPGRYERWETCTDIRVKISAEDTGIGISEEDLNTIFRPFHQIDSGTTKT